MTPGRDPNDWTSSSPRTLAPWRYLRRPGALGRAVRTARRPGPVPAGRHARRVVWPLVLAVVFVALLVVLLR